MKWIDISRLAPPGISIRQEIKYFGMGLAAALCIAVLAYGVSLRTAYDMLFDRYGVDRILRADAMMPDFISLLGMSLSFFYIVALCSLATAVFHHLSYYSGSKSIFLMRRLPQRWEILRRNITLPIVGAAISLLAAFLLMLLFLVVYYLVTPDQCLPPNQWNRIGGILLCWN